MVRLVQFERAAKQGGGRAVGLVGEDGASLQALREVETVYDLARRAVADGGGIDAAARALADGEAVDYAALAESNRLLPPLDHPDPACCWVTGTGLSHLGSAESRDAMHTKVAGDEAALTDSMKMFKWGLEGGKPAAGEIGVQPEWFYKGDGRCIAPPGHALPFPGFALDGGEEAELVGLYLIGEDGVPWRVGFCVGNEFSDHVMEKQNYLYLAHSKLRACAMGPELRTGPLPEDVQGTVRVLREDRELWRAAFASGEANMSHTIANLEHHHFKYGLFRRPGDVHCHFFGTATLSFAAGVEAQPGDVFEIGAEGFGRPLRNPLGRREEVAHIPVRAL